MPPGCSDTSGRLSAASRGCEEDRVRRGSPGDSIEASPARSTPDHHVADNILNLLYYSTLRLSPEASPERSAGPADPVGVDAIDAPNSSDKIVSVALVCVLRPAVSAAPGATEGAPRVLVARRRLDGPLGGLWEFPGGKVERGESVEAAARREAAEETGLTIHSMVPLAEVHHRYPHATVRLHAFTAHVEATAIASPRSSTECRWVPLDQLATLTWPAANLPILDALRQRGSSV